jgi:competence/damage-inducible protein CinA-like protein
MPSAEIITIGTEILLGEILDSNARYLARQLRDLGIDLYRKTTVGDNAGRIAQAIQQALERCDIILTTGGLGPTVDDPTREAIALALNIPTEFRPELWEQIQSRFKRYGRQPTENNKRQAYIPQGARAVENPVGTAPAFIVEIGPSEPRSGELRSQVIISLPGVPSEMEYLLESAILPYLRQHYQLSGIIKARLIHTAGVGESLIDERIGDLETLSNPTVGLAAHSGQVDVRITAKADSEAQANEMIQVIELDLRQRLGDWIYGVDQETLEEAALRALHSRGWTLAVVEFKSAVGLVNRLSSPQVARLGSLAQVFKGGELVIPLATAGDMAAQVAACRISRQVQVCLGVAIFPGAEKQDVALAWITPEGMQETLRPFGGPPEYAPRWAVHHALDILRKMAA